MARKSERQTAIDAMTAEGIPYEIASLVRHNAAAYATIQGRWCNEEMTERATARLEVREQRIEQRIRDLLAPYNVGATFHGDPRGYAVRLQFPSGRMNTWAQDGFGIA